MQQIDIVSLLSTWLGAVAPKVTESAHGVYGEFAAHLGAIKFVFVILSLALLAGIIYALKHSLREIHELKGLTLRDLFGLGFKPPRRYLKSWRIIENNLKSRERESMKLAVIEADALFKKLLSLMGHRNETLEHYLNHAAFVQFSNLEELKQAHEIAQGLVGDPHRFIDYDEAERAISAYRKTLEELYVIAPE